MRSHPIGVLGCGSYLPDEVILNDVVAAAVGVDPSWIEAKTGILSRRRAAPDQAASDLAHHAAVSALRDAGVRADQLSVIVVATSTPDFPQPPTACLLEHRLGAGNAAAFDLNAVCSGFVFGMETARRMIADGGYALVVGVDVYSRIVDPTDRRTAILFGDGAGAVVLGPVPDGRGVLTTRLASYGAHHDLIKVPAGGSRVPPSKDSLLAGEHYFTMNGREVRDFVTSAVPAAVREFLSGTGVDPAQVRHLVPHQANGRMLLDLAPELGLPHAQAHYTFHHFGNTGAASVPITLTAAKHEIDAGDLVLLAAFGGGMAIGLSLLRW